MEYGFRYDQCWTICYRFNIYSSFSFRIGCWYFCNWHSLGKSYNDYRQIRIESLSSHRYWRSVFFQSIFHFKINHFFFCSITYCRIYCFSILRRELFYWKIFDRFDYLSLEDHRFGWGCVLWDVSAERETRYWSKVVYLETANFDIADVLADYLEGFSFDFVYSGVYI